MKFDLLNKNSNIAIIIAGIISIFVGVGIARFSFTSLLPLMLNDFLTIKLVGFLASINYIGYLFGSIVAIFIKDIYTRIQFFRLGLIFSIISTIILALTKNETLWIISRIIAGFSTAMILVVCSSIILTKLNIEDKTKMMGIYYSGIGFSIVIVDLIIKTINLNDNLWQFSWLILTIFATIFSLYPIYILSLDRKMDIQIIKYKIEKNIFTPFVIILIISYFCEGIGFVVQATFLPDIINKLEGLEGFGNLTWLFVGVAGIPASIIWMKLAYKFGSTNMIIYALFIQIIGILIPTITNNMYLNILSGILYGGTFIGLSALFMNLVGKLSGKNPVVLMGVITTSYSLGMIIAPIYCVALHEKFNSHKYSLYVTALIVFLGALLLIYAKKKQIVKE
ncbi:MFS transporter permease [Aliarcobacter butzleri L355]|uniref:MFS transporter permease n=1 Tax=Aliarcobacter butzleri L355 TaxID=1447263 RepID=A0A0G9KMW8_9BACT|nr:YbfB/YjiJ family MFS transporter [Aliarcobacter butzleri]KLE07909.1 MFS transporter permease [Aliarcobacter butzleri L355]